MRLIKWIAFLGGMVILSTMVLGIWIRNKEPEHRESIPVAGQPVSSVASCVPGCVYLPMIGTQIRSQHTNRKKTATATIAVWAAAAPDCQTNPTFPVAGARIVILTEQETRTAETDSQGLALFTATEGPARIQIEWPVGYLPCPQSRPTVSLPEGNGMIRFLAFAPAYP